jgi:hypothetical protein
LGAPHGHVSFYPPNQTALIAVHSLYSFKHKL